MGASMAAMRAFGAELVEHGEDFEAARGRAIEMSSELGLHMIPSFHEDLLRGVSTYAYEFFAHERDLDTVYVPIGQGSGICSTIMIRDLFGLKTEVVGVVAENAASYALSFERGEAVSTNSADTIADGMACRVPDPAALEIILKGADRIVRVSEDDIRSAMRAYFIDTHNLAEGAGAAPLAALMRERVRMEGKRVGLILSGGNVDAGLFGSIIGEAA